MFTRVACANWFYVSNCSAVCIWLKDKRIIYCLLQHVFQSDKYKTAHFSQKNADRTTGENHFQTKLSSNVSNWRQANRLKMMNADKTKGNPKCSKRTAQNKRFGWLRHIRNTAPELTKFFNITYWTRVSQSFITNENILVVLNLFYCDGVESTFSLLQRFGYSELVPGFVGADERGSRPGFVRYLLSSAFVLCIGTSGSDHAIIFQPILSPDKLSYYRGIKFVTVS